MKNIFRLFMLVGVLAFASCEDESGLNNWFDKPAEGTGVEITLGSESIEISEDTQWGSFQMSWTEAVPPTSDYSIAGYKIMITPAEQPTATPWKTELDANTTSHTFVLRDIYLQIYNNWNYVFGEAMPLKVEVLADVTGGQFYYKPLISEATLTVTPQEIPVRSFYVVGDAVPAGNEPSKGIEVGCVNQGYSDQLNQNTNIILNPNSKFVLSLQKDSKFPAYMRGKKLEGDFVDGYEAVLVESEAEAENYEEFETLNPYKEQSLGDKNNYAVSIEYDSQTREAKVYYGRKCTKDVYAVGDAVARAWGTWIQFSWDYRYPDVVYLAQEFFDKPTTGSEGNFKLHTSKGYTGSGESWRPAAGTDPFNNHDVVTQFGGDPKFHIPDGKGGNYICVLNNADLTIYMLPY